jgi:hypothetical protein
MGYHRIETFTDQQVGQKLVKIINFGKKKHLSQQQLQKFEGERRKTDIS